MASQKHDSYKNNVKIDAETFYDLQVWLMVVVIVRSKAEQANE